MYQGKLDIVKAEMSRIGIEVLGISELKWTGLGHFNTGDYHIYYSGHASHKANGVAFICNKSSNKAVLGYNPINDRIIAIRFKGKPINLTLIQVYAPTSAAPEQEREDFYGNLQEAYDAAPSGDIKIIMGDFNAKVGSTVTNKITGRFGLGTRNEPGEDLVDFCAGSNLFVANTCFKTHKRRLFTWTSPDGRTKNQIDYIIGQQRWRSAITATCTKPSADCGSDHELLAFKIGTKLKRRKKSPKSCTMLVTYQTLLQQRLETDSTLSYLMIKTLKNNGHRLKQS